MRALLAAALGAATALSGQAGGGPVVETVYSGPGTIAALAQDGPLVAWFGRAAKGCNAVHVLSLTNGLQTTLPRQGSARNVTCVWPVGSTPVRLALAGNRAAWTLRQESPIPFDYLLGASTSAPKERRFQEFAHTRRGVGLWLGAVSGNRETLVYAIASVDYVDEAGCLTQSGSCALKLAGGGVYRMVGRQTPKLVPGTDAAGAVTVSAGEGAVAVLPGATVTKDGRPAAGADRPIQIVDPVTGDAISQVSPRGVPLAIALAPSVLGTLERTTSGLRIAWYDRATGVEEGAAPVPADTSPELGAGDHDFVFRVGRSIRAVDLQTGKARVLASAAASPVGLSVEGRRVAWGENLKGTARIRALTLTP